MSRSTVELKLTPAHLRTFNLLIADNRNEGDQLAAWLRSHRYKISRTAMYTYMRRRRAGVPATPFRFIGGSDRQLRHKLAEASMGLRGAGLMMLASYAVYLANVLAAPSGGSAGRRRRQARRSRRR